MTEALIDEAQRRFKLAADDYRYQKEIEERE
jgi:hypothetical protein